MDQEGAVVESVYINGVNSAGFGQRFAGQLLDAVLIAVVSLVVSRVVKGPAINAITWPLTVIYYTVFEGETGQTLGKRAVKVKVVDIETGEPIGYARAFRRFIVSWVSFVVLLAGYLWMLGDAEGQTWHDKAARAIVVQTD